MIMSKLSTDINETNKTTLWLTIMGLSAGIAALVAGGPFCLVLGGLNLFGAGVACHDYLASGDWLGEEKENN